MRVNGIFITSLNSRRLKDAIANKNNFHFNNEVDDLDVFVFDTFEVLNGIFFNDTNAGSQKETIEDFIKSLEENFIAVDTVKRELIRCTKIRKELNYYIGVVFSEYYSNPVFESHCRNQIFQNLQPKLKNVGVLNNKSNLIEILIPFLVVEIAVYLSIYDKGFYSKVFGLEDEMNIVISIKEGKYPVFEKYLKHKIDYTKIMIN